jgi:hypothetical protein
MRERVASGFGSTLCMAYGVCRIDGMKVVMLMNDSKGESAVWSASTICSLPFTDYFNNYQNHSFVVFYDPMIEFVIICSNKMDIFCRANAAAVSD